MSWALNRERDASHCQWPTVVYRGVHPQKTTTIFMTSRQSRTRPKNGGFQRYSLLWFSHKLSNIGPLQGVKISLGVREVGYTATNSPQVLSCRCRGGSRVGERCDITVSHITDRTETSRPRPPSRIFCSANKASAAAAGDGGLHADVVRYS